MNPQLSNISFDLGTLTFTPTPFSLTSHSYRITSNQSSIRIVLTYEEDTNSSTAKIVYGKAQDASSLQSVTVNIPAGTPGHTNSITQTISVNSDFNYLSIIFNPPGAGYIFSKTLAPDQSNKYPIEQHYLNPGFFGGTYVSTYRRLWNIYSVGNGPDYPNVDYEAKAVENEVTMEEIMTLLKRAAIVGKADAICELFCHYSGFVNSNWADSSSGANSYDYRFYLPIIQVSVLRPQQLMGGYIPKNKKLFCYPFSSMEIIGYGQNQELKYENFDDKTNLIKYFGIVSKFVPGATIMLYPFDYDGVQDNFDNGVCGNELQVFPYTIDKYLNDYNASRNTRTQNMAAMMQNAGMEAINTAVGLGSGIRGDITKNVTPAKYTYHNAPADYIGKGYMGFEDSRPMTAGPEMISPASTSYKLGMKGGFMPGVSAAGKMAAQIAGSALTIHQGYAAMAAQLADVQNRPPVISNQNGAPSISMAIKNAACPYIIFKSIRKEIAERIDTFFTRFGYRTNRQGKPNIWKRPNYYFLKCNNAVVGGNIPAEDKQMIKTILEKGITFWHTSNQGFTNVLDYSMSNNPINS